MFSLRRDIGKQTITFLATGNFNSIFNLFFKKIKRQTQTRKADESVVRIEENSFIYEAVNKRLKTNFIQAVSAVFMARGLEKEQHAAKFINGE